MFYRSNILAGLVALAAVALTAGHWLNMATAKSTDDGIVRFKSSFNVDETVQRLQADIERKGIKFFMLVDQAQLGADAGLKLNPSKLLVFGNPPLGITFLTANPNAGLDWPVRLLVTRDDTGQVWVAYTDFAWIARRHNVTNRAAQFRMAWEVISSITASVAAPKP